VHIRTSDVVIRDVSQTYDDSGKLERINKIGLANEPHGWRRGVTCRELVMDENTSRAAALNARPSSEQSGSAMGMYTVHHTIHFCWGGRAGSHYIVCKKCRW